MSAEAPSHDDAKLVLRLYDLRRETVMRASRDAINGRFLPRSWEEVLAVTKPDHPLNAAWRQVSSYWEMTYAIVKHGIVHPEYFMESNGEGLLLYVRIEPYLPRMRQELSALSFLNSEWVATNTDRGRKLVELFRKRLHMQLAAKPS